MSEENDDGGQAFATDRRDGMSLRDWFAGLAMQGLLESMEDSGQACAILQVADDHELEVNQMIAEMAYKSADAMLAARKK